MKSNLKVSATDGVKLRGFIDIVEPNSNVSVKLCSQNTEVSFTPRSPRNVKVIRQTLEYTQLMSQNLEVSLTLATESDSTVLLEYNTEMYLTLLVSL
jgi:hypothetical protein